MKSISALLLLGVANPAVGCPAVVPCPVSDMSAGDPSEGILPTAAGPVWSDCKGPKTPKRNQKTPKKTHHVFGHKNFSPPMHFYCIFYIDF